MTGPEPAARGGGAGVSRAAAFAMRAALVAAAPAALGCGGEDGTRQRYTEDVATAGSGGSGGATLQGTAGGHSASPIQLEPEQPPVADAGADAEPYTPVPIYGGVFPDPMNRARV